MIHAQLNSDGVCTGYSNLIRIETAPDVVFLPDGWNDDYLYRKWLGDSWSSEKYTPQPNPDSPSITDEIAALKAQNAEILLALVSNDLI